MSNLIEGLQLLEKYDTYVAADFGVVFAGPANPEDVLEPDAMVLQGLGWFVDDAIRQRWAVYVEAIICTDN